MLIEYLLFWNNLLFLFLSTNLFGTLHNKDNLEMEKPKPKEIKSVLRLAHAICDPVVTRIGSDFFPSHIMI
jgi:hypothetical protein